MIVGMVTVFAILGLVVLSGRLLIKFVNRFFPESRLPNPAPAPISTAPSQISTTQQSKSTLAAIVTAVDIITKGKGKIDEIEKLNQ